ncbi:MAG: glutamine-hydrolyzing carbamoyl-phosphate synthase small subunit [Deltaproteobacteria bacterium]|nr:glutamine-hydrolyzing carbamoyl-phosphate synthase small subunit [Deltaproteobacteria bacterium]
MTKKAHLVLADGTIFEGESFGFEGETSGEVVFNTSITGYQEILTDPSYCRQIVILTYPMIGNYGVNREDAESSKIQAAGLIIKEYCEHPSNWRSTQSLAQYLRDNKIVGVHKLPTREIVRHIRDKGAMPGILTTDNGQWTMDYGPKTAEKGNSLIEKAKKLPSMAGQELVHEVTCKTSYVVPPAGGKKEYSIVAYDFGIKQNIVRELAKRNCEVTVVPALTKPADVLKMKPNGVLFSNGPGDPAACEEIVENIRSLIGKLPIMGICLGHQLLGLALGAKTFKLKFGHRGANQPVKDLKNDKVLITSQNHGFSIDPASIPAEMIVTQINLNDQTVEAFEHKKYPILSVQYHPEAAPGPHDANNIFNKFIEMVTNGNSKY